MSARILVIDDETNIRTMIRLALEHVGYEVETASDGQEGLQKFGNGEGWDLVLLDQRMPGMAGIDVLKEIYRRNHSARVILITAFGTIDLAIEAIQSGASDFLRKPFTVDTLRGAVRNALAREVKRMAAVPVDLVCREFSRTAINGYSFEVMETYQDEQTLDIVCHFQVTGADLKAHQVTVVLPAYVTELVKAHFDAETLPYGNRLWQAMCEETLANYLWQNAELPPDGRIQVENLSSSIREWLEKVLTVDTSEHHA
jgi:DNA-binding response OmpR family regulator